MQGLQVQEQGASREEKAFLEEVGGSPWEGEGTEVSGDEEVQWVEACLQVVEWAACWGQRVDVQMVVVAGVPSSYQKEVAVASEVVVGLVTRGSGQAQVKGPGTVLPAAPFCCR